VGDEAKVTDMSGRMSGELPVEEVQRQLAIDRDGAWIEHAVRVAYRTGTPAQCWPGLSKTSTRPSPGFPMPLRRMKLTIDEGSRSEASIRPAPPVHPVRPVSPGPPGLGAPGDVDSGGSFDTESGQQLPCLTKEGGLSVVR
jgi:hypothetical protein